MDFVNRTAVPAAFLPGSTGDREMIGIVAAKATFLVDGAELVAVTGEDAWPVFDRPFAFRGAMLGAETDFRKAGVDLVVFGSARAPGGQPVPWMEVSVECGRLRHGALVVGDRVWLRHGGTLAPSEARPFTEMPLTNDRAFGGSAKLGDVAVAHPANPEGRGLVLEETEAEGVPLPNVEDPRNLIRSWTDRPRPVCFFRPTGVLLPEGREEGPPERFLPAIMESAFNQSVPELVARPHELAEVIHLRGFAEEGDLAIPMPPQEGPSVHVRVGELRSRFPARLSTVAVLPDERVVVATYLALFRYLVRPEELRSVELRWPGGPEAEGSQPGGPEAETREPGGPGAGASRSGGLEAEARRQEDEAGA